MSIKFKHMLPLLAAVLTATACEEVITPDDRYEPASATAPARSVLLEEFTGSDCLYGSNGDAVVRAIEQVYNTPWNIEQDHEVVVVEFNLPDSGQSDDRGGLTAPETESLVPDGVTPPMARVNRTGRLLNRDRWAAAVAERIGVAPILTFPTSVAAELHNGTIAISGNISAGINISDARLHVWLTEDNVVSPQLMPDGTTDDEYVHNNVFRAAVTSVQGQSKSFTRNLEQSFKYFYPLNPLWDAEYLHAVVFVETEIDGVLNATRARVSRTD